MGERRAGIVVDGMLSQQEIVVKGFDAPHGTLPCSAAPPSWAMACPH